MIKIAIPNKGRMLKPTISLLKNSGFEPKDFNERKLCAETNYSNIKILFMRTEDIGPYVQSKVADLGITGYDIAVEKKLSVERILDLNYGFCKLVLAGPKSKQLKNGIKIAILKLQIKMMRRLGENMLHLVAIELFCLRLRQ